MYVIYATNLLSAASCLSECGPLQAHLPVAHFFGKVVMSLSIIGTIFVAIHNSTHACHQIPESMNDWHRLHVNLYANLAL
jgi:hypothetical protein